MMGMVHRRCFNLKAGILQRNEFGNYYKMPELYHLGISAQGNSASRWSHKDGQSFFLFANNLLLGEISGSIEHDVGRIGRKYTDPAVCGRDERHIRRHCSVCRI
jgi:hypothetical protein